MPLYRFDIPLGEPSQDLDLPSDDEAWSQAVSYMGELLKDMHGKLPGDTRWRIRVSQDGRDVAEINLDTKRGA